MTRSCDDPEDPHRFHGLFSSATDEWPTPQAVFDEAHPSGRIFTIILGRETPASDADVEARLVREIRYDPDVWIVEVEDRAGRNFLDDAVV